jgi:allantoinase
MHFNEPERTSWEGAATGAGARGRRRDHIFDMPLNSTPCTVNVGELERKRAALEAASVADFGLWGGLVPGTVPEMADMAAHGVVGFKAFLCDSGLPEFPRADDLTLFEGMREAARLTSRSRCTPEAGAHCRPGGGCAVGRARLPERASGRRRARAISARCSCQSDRRQPSPRSRELGTRRGAGFRAQARGANVSIETCAHYL